MAKGKKKVWLQVTKLTWKKKLNTMTERNLDLIIASKPHFHAEHGGGSATFFSIPIFPLPPTKQHTHNA